MSLEYQLRTIIMAFIDDFKASCTKGVFLIENLGLHYDALCAIKTEERALLVKDLFDNRTTYNFITLIKELAAACYREKRNEFIRGGSSDFLGDLLQHLVRHFDSGKLYDASYPETYEAHSEVSMYLNHVTEHLVETFGPESLTNLPRNMILKIFNPIVSTKLPITQESIIVMKQLQEISTNATRCSAFLNRILGQEVIILSPYDELMDIKKGVSKNSPKSPSSKHGAFWRQSSAPQLPQAFDVESIINEFECGTIDADEALDRIKSIEQIPASSSEPGKNPSIWNNCILQ